MHASTQGDPTCGGYEEPENQAAERPLCMTVKLV